METKQLTINYSLYRESVPPQYARLCARAAEAAASAYSIFYGFSVGAAVLLANGEVVCGSNQENAAYPSGTCAERTALFYSGAAFPGVAVRALAIAASSGGAPCENFVSPCGACRQVMAEMLRRYGQDFDVVLVGARETLLLRASALLPFAFELPEGE